MSSRELVFRFIAPGLTNFAPRPGSLERAGDEDVTFWSNVASATGWDCVRGAPASGGAFSLATGDVLDRPLEVLHRRLDVQSETGVHGVRWAWVRCALYEHNVLTLDGELVIQTDDALPVQTAARELEERIQDLVRGLITRLVIPAVRDLCAGIQRQETAEVYVEIESGLEVYAAPQWVSRALMCRVEEMDSWMKGVAEHWLEGTGEDVVEALTEFDAGKRQSVAAWMNYFYRVGDGTQMHWEAMRRAQFFYTATGRVDSALGRILAWTMTSNADRISVKKLELLLHQSVVHAQDLLLLKAQVGRSANRMSRAETEQILRSWDYYGVLEAPVREKNTICAERIAQLRESRSSRNSIYTDMILMAIGATSIVATGIALVQFGREAGSDPGQAVFDARNSGVISWLSSQSTDSVFLICLGIAIVLMVLFLWKRK